MRFTFSLKNLSLSLALVSLASAGAASAQSLAGVNARLIQSLDSQSAAQGQAVSVKLDGSVKTTDGVKLPKGTELIGKVAAVQPSQNGGPASVSVVFTSAQLKGGKQIPVKATLLAAYPASEHSDAETADQSIVSLPDHVSDDHTIDQEPGALPGITLTAAVKDPTSGTFTKTTGNFKLSAGTFLQLGVAPATASSTTSAAE